MAFENLSDNSMIGQCDVNMKVSQNIANGHFYTDKSGTQREIPSHTYTFKAIIEPCEVALTSLIDLNLMVMSLGDASMS